MFSETPALGENTHDDDDDDDDDIFNTVPITVQSLYIVPSYKDYKR